MPTETKLAISAHTPQIVSKFTFSEAKGNDLDELSHVLSTPNSPIRVCGHVGEPVSYQCNFVSFGDVSMADCSYKGTITTYREAPSDKMLVFLPVYGNACYMQQGEEIYSAAGQGHIIESHRTVGPIRLLGPRRHLGLFINKEKITTHLTHLLGRTISGPLDISHKLELKHGSGFLIVQLVEQLLRGAEDSGVLGRSPLACQSLCDALVYMLLENCANRYSNELERTAPSPAPRHVKWAIDFMHEHVAEPISLIDVAKAAKVSIRTLQQGFRQFRNTSPIAYLHEIRLVAAHHELSQAPTGKTVTEIALKWGFTHLGRFACDYRRRFGETPSQTIRNGAN
ncbi:AraC family transcriptional regulator [Agrobacterium deltaense]|uniref:helix-turn-helix transcriptional regulator n=1 Tax=Agrobacterium deltaense TaxID=1183412 RepID=UPI003D9518A4